MNKETLTNLVNQHLSIRAIAKELNIGATTVRHYLAKYDLKTIQKPKVELTSKCCLMCNEVKDLSEFYKIKSRN